VRSVVEGRWMNIFDATVRLHSRRTRTRADFETAMKSRTTFATCAYGSTMSVLKIWQLLAIEFRRRSRTSWATALEVIVSKSASPGKAKLGFALSPYIDSPNPNQDNHEVQNPELPINNKFGFENRAHQ
jgi:hypothetical protein